MLYRLGPKERADLIIGGEAPRVVTVRAFTDLTPDTTAPILLESQRNELVFGDLVFCRPFSLEMRDGLSMGGHLLRIEAGVIEC